MGEKKNHTDRAFRDALRRYQADPPESVWTGITDSLEAKRRKSRVILFKRLAAAAAVLIAAGGTWILVQRSQDAALVSSEVQPAGTESVQPGAGQVPETGTEEGGIRVSRESGMPQETGQEERSVDESPEEPPALKPQETIADNGLAELPPDRARGTGSTGVERAEEQGESVPAEPEEPPVPVNRLIADIQVPDIPLDLAVNRRPALIITDEEQGIDVFEEFGEKGKADRKKWGIGGQVSPVYSYRNLSTTENTQYAAGNLNDIENGIVSYAGGLNLNFYPSRRFGLQSGIYYSRLGMSVGSEYLASAQDASYQVFPPPKESQGNSTGMIDIGDQPSDRKDEFIYTNSPDTWDNEPTTEVADEPEIQQGKILQHFEYLEVPLILKYRIVDRRLGLNLLGGLSTNFLVGSDVYLQEGQDREYIGTTEELNPVSYSSVLGLGLQYSLSRHVSLSMEPTFRYYLNSVNPAPGLGSHPYSLGFFTGVSYLF